MAEYTLELLHTADQEAGIPALDDAPRFSAVLNALKAEDLGADGLADNTLVLSSGDAFIPGLFFSASTDVYGGPGIADTLIQNELGFQAIALGNHEFDLGPDLVADLILPGFITDGALTEAQQVDMVVADGPAEGEFSAVLSGNTLTVSGEYSGLTSDLSPVGGADAAGNPESAIHIHLGEAGNNGPIARNLTVTPDDDEAGAGEFEGTFTLTDEEVAIAEADGLYINVHTEDNPSGELRGQIAPEFLYSGTDFPYLSANLDFSTEPALADLVVEGGTAPEPNSIAPSTVIEVNGEKIGVVGATTPTVDVISSPGDITIAPAEFEGDPTPAQLDALAAEIQADVDALLAANPDVNKVVLLSHMQQLSIEQGLAQRLSNVDIIVGGGSNTRLVDETDRLRDGDTDQGPYPIFETDADGNPVAVVNTDGNYKYVGRLVVDFDDSGVIIPDSYDPAVSGAYATDAAGVAALGAEGLVDPEIQAIVDALGEAITAKESNVFGISDVYLDGTRGSVRTEETNLGNLTADANLAIAREITGDDSILVSLKNGGGIRDDIGRVVVPAGGTGEPERLPNEAIPGVKPEGGISETDIGNTLRFNNGLTVLNITRQGLVAVLEHGVAASSLDDSNTQGRFPQVSGVEFSFDLTATPGDRIQSAAIKDDDGNIVDVLVQDGELVGDPSATVKIVTLGFLAGGGDGYPFQEFGSNFMELAQEDEAPRTGEATFAPDGSEQDALAEYLADNFPVDDDPTTPVFNQEETPRAEDTRLQNLAFREDTVLGNVAVPPMDGAFQLHLLHATDQEGAAPALVDAPNLSAVLNALEDDFDNTLILSSGDLWLPGLFYDASEEIYGASGIADVLINNALGIQAAAFGNHEFDLGTEDIATLLSANPDITGPGIGPDGYQGTAFPYLSANLDFSADENLADLVVEDGQDVSTIANGIAKSAIVNVGGEKIGLVGATTPTLPSVSSPGEGVGVSPADPQDYDELAAIIQAEVDELLATNPDLNKVVLMAHMQVLDIEVNELAPRLTGVDIIIGGGSDTILANEPNRLRDGDAAAGSYPILQEAADGNPVAIVNTDGQYLYVGQLVVEFDENGIIVPDSIDPAISGAYATDEAGIAALDAEGLTDPVITEVIDALNAVIADKESNIFGITENFLNGRRSGGGLDGVRNQETNLGNLTADANLWYGKLFDETVQISLKNGGGIRESIGSVVTPPGGTEPVRIPPEANPNFGKPEGGITQTDVESVLAFNNGLTLITTTVEELKAILEHTVSRATEDNIDGEVGSFGQVAGIKFSFDITFPPRETDPITNEETAAGQRVRSLALVDEEGEVTDVLVQDGEIQGDPTRSFRMITLNFLADGGSNYPIPQTDRVDLVEQSGFDTGLASFTETGSEQDALAEYLANVFPADNDPNTPTFDQEDTPREEDERIQNLLFREDTVLGEGTGDPVTPPPVEEPDFSDGFEGPFFKVAGLQLSEGSEINTFDPVRQVMYVVSGGDVLQVVDLSDPANPTTLFNIDVEAAAGVPIGGVNSVAYSDNVLALAVEADTVTDPGVVVLVDLATFADDPANSVNALPVGALPDMVTFTPDGEKVLVANEGEPNFDYSVDPEGSVSIIDLSGGVTSATVNTADFLAFNDQAAELKENGLKLFGPEGTTLAEEVEPEYIAVSPDGTTAWATLQEANGIGVVDIENGVISDILPLGFKDHSLPENQLDASNRDDGINIQNWPVFGTYQPDSIASYEVDGMTYYVTANEGDARIRPDGDLEDEDGNVLFEEGEFFNEEARVADLTLDPDAFPNAEELQLDENLGRLNVTDRLGDTDGDGDFDELYAYGARSFSIWDSAGNLVFDSGDDIARLTAQLTPELFNANDGDPEEFDNRSDDKGAEPEALTVGQIGDKTYAFVGLERAGGGVLIYDVTNPAGAEFVQYVRSDEDIAPEGLTLVSGEDSPSGSPLLLVTNEESSTLAVYSTRNPIVSDGESERLIGTDLPDSIVGLGSDGLINGLDGDDLLKGSDGDDTLKGSDGDDLIMGGLGDDLLNGGAGNDEILGGAGDDSILGGAGDDLITGGLGGDAMTGGAGADTFIYNSVDEGGDNIRLFELGIDKISIQPLLANSGIMVGDVEDAMAQGFLMVQENNPRRASVLFDADGAAGAGDAVELTTVKVSSGMAADLSAAENFIV